LYKVYFMDIHTRRNLLETNSNPDRRLDYVVTLQGSISTDVNEHRPATVRLRYVPDALILLPPTFLHYLNTLGSLNWQSLEHLANTVLDDFNNEVIPRWIQLNVTAKLGEDMEGEHSIVLEDHQPAWQNERLVSRLKPL